jgi:hypothetical protein
MSNARVIDGHIELCAKFLTLETINDQVATIWHEIYHINNDLAWNPTSVQLPTPITLSVPNWVENYIKNVIYDGYTGSMLQNLYLELITINSISDTQYYLNEIANQYYNE